MLVYAKNAHPNIYIILVKIFAAPNEFIRFHLACHLQDATNVAFFVVHL